MMRNSFVRLTMMVAVLLWYSTVAVAVQLPSSSYTPYSSGEYDSAYGDGSSTTNSSGSFLQLGTADDTWCRSFDPQTQQKMCEDCCVDEYNSCMALVAQGLVTEQDCNDSSLSCGRYCDGASLPLDAPLWYMLALAAVGATFAVMRKKNSYPY